MSRKGGDRQSQSRWSHAGEDKLFHVVEKNRSSMGGVQGIVSSEGSRGGTLTGEF